MQVSRLICALAGALLMAPVALAQDGTEKSEGAIRTFAAAVESEDFALAFDLLTPAAQKGFWTTVSQGATGKVFPNAPSLDIGADWPLDEKEAFVAYMEAAAEADSLPFSLPDLTFVRPTVDEPDVVIHMMYTGGEPEIIVIQTNRTKKGWRLNKFSWSRTDGETLPWGFR